MTFTDAHRAAARRLLEAGKSKGLMVATAESCTGGLIAGLITEIAGSSAVFDRGFVTYTNEAKHEMLGVPVDLINTHGAVSGPVAEAMAHGALLRSDAHIAVSVTGIAGPGGATPTKPVGLVWFGLAVRDRLTTSSRQSVFVGGRTDVRSQAVGEALDMLLEAVV